MNYGELIKLKMNIKNWITNMSHEYKKSQIKAAVKVNEKKCSSFIGY